MQDVVQVAKARRAELGWEIHRLDEFIRMAESLARSDGHSDILYSDTMSGSRGSSPGGEVAVAHDNERTQASHANSVTQQSKEADLSGSLFRHAEGDASARQDRPVTVEAAAAPSHAGHGASSRFANYVGVIKDRLRPRSTRPESASAVPPVATNALSSYSAGTATSRVQGPADRVKITGEPVVPAVEPAAGEQETLATGTKVQRPPAQQPVDSMQGLVSSIEKLRERALQIALPVDVHVGQRIRQRRWMLGMTQSQLSEQIGVTVQQFKRQESGVECIHAPRLLEISRLLHVPVAFFFEGLDKEPVDSGGPRIEALSEQEARALSGFGAEDTFHYDLPQSA